MKQEPDKSDVSIDLQRAGLRLRLTAEVLNRPHSTSNLRPTKISSFETVSEAGSGGGFFFQTVGVDDHGKGVVDVELCVLSRY